MAEDAMTAENPTPVSAIPETARGTLVSDSPPPATPSLIDGAPVLSSSSMTGTGYEPRLLAVTPDSTSTLLSSAHAVQLGTDLSRLGRLEGISQQVRSSVLNGEEPSRFPDRQALIDSYYRGSDNEKKRIKDKVHSVVEREVGLTKSLLVNDIRTLHLDRGATDDEAETEILRFNKRVVKGKTKPFGQLGIEGQLAILAEALRTRRELLIENIDHYLYFLRSVSFDSEIAMARISELEAEFERAMPKRQAAIAAKARRDAIEAMTRSMEVNAGRLNEIEKEERVAQPLADLYEEQFEHSTLRQKGNIIEAINARKVTLSLPHIHEIYRLRRILEDGIGQAEVRDPHGYHSQEALLLAEIARIGELVRKNRAAVGRNVGGPAAELGMEEAEDTVDGFARLHKDPSLLGIFRRVALLRITSSDSFNF